jgi:tetratricopeptide (TPR) repeat protein
MGKVLTLLLLSASLALSEVEFKTRKDYEDFVSALERNPRAQFDLANVYMLGAKAGGEAIPPDFARAEKLLAKSSYPQSKIVLAMTYAEQGKAMQSLDSYISALELSKNDPKIFEMTAILMGAYILDNLSDNSGALDVNEATLVPLTARGNNPKVALLAAYTLAKKKEFDRANIYLNIACNQPDLPDEVSKACYDNYEVEVLNNDGKIVGRCNVR